MRFLEPHLRSSSKASTAFRFLASGFSQGSIALSGSGMMQRSWPAAATSGDCKHHVITFVPSLDLYLDSTARLAPFVALPAEVQDKPVLLTATGREARTPLSSPSADYTHTRIWMQVSDTGEVWGRRRR
jgi:hypothetical protein